MPDRFDPPVAEALSEEQVQARDPAAFGIAIGGTGYVRPEVEAQYYKYVRCPAGGGHVNEVWVEPSRTMYYRCWACGAPFEV
jgi:hypothetical protein